FAVEFVPKPDEGECYNPTPDVFDQVINALVSTLIIILFGD
ncbi:7124_t:CDS:1, partial [Funneliformis caledonium]